MDLSMAGGLLRLARAALRWLSLRGPTFAGWRFRNPCAAPRRPFLSCGSVLTPNKRLKLSGGDRFKGSGVLCPWRARTVVHYPCAGGRVARSLSAIRWPNDRPFAYIPDL